MLKIYYLELILLKIYLLLETIHQKKPIEQLIILDRVIILEVNPADIMLEILF